jgi:hypothetical protein
MGVRTATQTCQLPLLWLDQVGRYGGFQQLVEHLLGQQGRHSAGGNFPEKLFQIQDGRIGCC